MRYKHSRSKTKAAFAILAPLLLATAVITQPAQAQKFKVLHTFKGSDGIGPDAQLVRDSSGNLYGTAGGGGTGKCGNPGCGTAFKMDKTGKLVWVHSFWGEDGWQPFPGLLRDAAGNLYGTTAYGGKTSHPCPSAGCGVVFKLNKNGKETVLHKFSGVDGWPPVGPLVEDQGGNLYGATQYGSDGGVVFKLDKRGRETVLYSFGCGSHHGCDPGAGVILDAVDNIYGTTFIGGDLNCNPGQGCGEVFKVDTGGHETVLHVFEGSDGANPWSPLLLDSAGNLYGTTQKGGNLDCQGGLGCGVAYKLSPNSNGTWAETVLYTFCSASNCADGQFPSAGGLIQDSAGNLYGTTIEGGAYAGGVVFELDASGAETVVHNFTGGADGYYPLVGVTLDVAGNLYGTATDGGGRGDGTVFEIQSVAHPLE